MSVPGEVLDELEKRIKRLQAVIEIAESVPSPEVRPVPKPPSSFSVYLWMSAAWFIGGLLIIYFLRSRYGGTLSNAPTGVSLAVYAILALGVVVLLVAYYLSRRREEGEVFDIDERARAARRLLKEFYLPLKEAFKWGDEEAIRALADRLLEDPLLARAMEILREGDPKLCAYALYLYVSRESVGEDEIKEALERLDNKPLRRLLSALLEGQRI
ncbi:hypothetical protein [Thermococcus sp. AM4]|uniref:hypothetical protein n=1 Tax=Thermococcus sp. (strain AM4) TaxID=246969 RepID=UPI000186FA38|nr:hypothetical protein [Thermococcus sp. AM4]EEB74832.1 conserved hypothetical protein [Thermococcus sp. AM4]